MADPVVRYALALVWRLALCVWNESGEHAHVDPPLLCHKISQNPSCKTVSDTNSRGTLWALTVVIDPVSPLTSTLGGGVGSRIRIPMFVNNSIDSTQIKKLGDVAP